MSAATSAQRPLVFSRAATSSSSSSMIFVQLVDLSPVDVGFDETALVVDRNRGSISDRVLNVLDTDLVAKDDADAFVFLSNRCPSEADE